MFGQLRLLSRECGAAAGRELRRRMGAVRRGLPGALPHHLLPSRGRDVAEALGQVADAREPDDPWAAAEHLVQVAAEVRVQGALCGLMKFL